MGGVLFWYGEVLFEEEVTREPGKEFSIRCGSAWKRVVLLESETEKLRSLFHDNLKAYVAGKRNMELSSKTFLLCMIFWFIK